MQEIISYIKREWIFLTILIIFITLTQYIILKSHLDFGFTPDDIWFFSDFSALGPDPLLQFNKLLQKEGIYHAPHIFYNGILFSFFGFNIQSYQNASLVFKILSIVSLYLLIHVISKNRLFAFISALIFSIHYAALGSFEMVSRTQDYLLLTSINIFFIFLYLIYRNRPKSILWIILVSLFLFCSFFINPIRAYPLLIFILFLGIIIFFQNKTFSNFKWVAKNFIILFLPFILFTIIRDSSEGVPNNFFITLQKASQGNLQVFFTPLTTIGGLFLVGDSLIPLRAASWNIDSFIPFFLGGPLLIFGLLTFLLSFVIPKKPLIFFPLVLTLNIALDYLVFLIITNLQNLPPTVRLNYDTPTNTPAALLGIYVVILSLIIFREWVLNNKNTYFAFYLIGMLFAAFSIIFTWIFQDFIYIPLGINGYSTLPSMGVSVSFAAILMLFYKKVKDNKFIENFAPLVFLVLLPFFIISNREMQMYLNRYLYGGGMKASDQIYLKDRFWSFIDNPSSCNKIFYIEKESNPFNSYHYDVVMLDRFDKWYNLYSPHHSKINCPVGLIRDKEKLKLSYDSSDNTEGFFYKDFEGEDKFFPIKDFYAFKLQNRDIIDIKSEVVKYLRSK